MSPAYYLREGTYPLQVQICGDMLSETTCTICNKNMYCVYVEITNKSDYVNLTYAEMLKAKCTRRIY